MSWSYRLAACYAVWLASICTFIEWSGVARLQLTPTVAWAFALVGAALAFLFYRWASVLSPLPEASPSRNNLRATAAAWLIVIPSLAAYALLWVPAYFHPDITWDGMTYHLPTIHLWAKEGFVHWISTPSEAGEGWKLYADALLNGYPKTGESVGFFLAQLSGGNLVNASNLAFLPLAILAIAALAEELGASRPSAIAGGLLFVLVPTNVGQAASTYVDTAFASATVYCLAFLYLQLRSVLTSEDARLPRPIVVASGAGIGLALGVKGPALGLAALSVFAVAVAATIRLRRRPGRSRHALILAAAVGLAGTVALPVGGFWYLRNAVVTHNPMYPFEIKVAGHVVFPGIPVSDMISEETNTPPFMRNMSQAGKIARAWAQGGDLEWPIDAITEHNADGYAIPVPGGYRWPRSIRYNDPRVGGLGFLWLFGGIPSLIAVIGIALYKVRRGSKEERPQAARDALALGLFLATCAVFFAITPMSWWARYTLWLHAAGLSALALVLHHILIGLSQRRWYAFAAAPFAVMLLSLAFFEFAYALKWDHSLAYFVGPARIDRHSGPRDLWSALTTSKDNGISAIYIDLANNELARAALSGDQIVAVGPLSVSGGPVLGQLSMPVGRKTWIMAPSEIGTDQETATQFVRRYLPRYIVWDLERSGPAPVLEQTARRWVWCGSLMIFEFGDGQHKATILLPK